MKTQEQKQTLKEFDQQQEKLEQQKSRCEIKTRMTQLTVAPEGADLYDERSTHIDIDDEGGGEFITVSQYSCTTGIRIDANEWPAIRAAIDRLFEECNP